MAVESIFYSVSGISCRGALIWEEGVKASRPLLLMAPNWRGVIKPAIEAGQMLAAEGYVVFVADMFGEGNGPVGTENPMEFLRPFMSDVPGMRRRIAAALDTLTREADRRAIGDITRRAAMGFCFGGLNVLDLARTGADVQAVVSMHGTLTTPQPANKGDIKAAVLAVHGAADPIAPKAERDAFEAEMTSAGARWALLTFIADAFAAMWSMPLPTRKPTIRAWGCTTSPPPGMATRSRTPTSPMPSPGSCEVAPGRTRHDNLRG
jgi:dienelactone hydrolase